MNKLTRFISISFLIAAFFDGATTAAAKTIRYELTATRGSINLSGKKSVDFALMLNGSIPAPTLEFTEGDEAEIVVKNAIPNEELSIHWHGLLLPNEMDGVPYVTTPPIHSGDKHVFRFKLRQNGTYWYHSHTNVQEQKGLYGAFVIHPKKSKIHADFEEVVVLSDWSDENATDILKNLRKDGDYYLYKKETIRSWWGAIQAGKLSNFLANELTRMGGMDYSDVGYDAFLINGKREIALTPARAGQTVRLRIINASASTYFYVALANQAMKVVSADGIDVQPMLANELLLGMAETYDIVFTVPSSNRFELLATAQDGTGTVSAWIGAGPPVSAARKPYPDLYAKMDHSGHGAEHSQHDEHASQTMADHSEHGGHDHTSHSPLEPIDTMTVDALKATTPTEFKNSKPVHDVKLVLNGDMRRYIWHINGKAIHQDRNIVIRPDETVRFTLENQTMMHHPMHLHGHFFRVLTSAGDYSPLKHTVDVAPHTTRTIEFLADEPGEWMLHCHNLYHLKTGMARVVKYSTFTPKPEIAEHQAHDPHLHDHWYAYSLIEGASNHAQARFRLSQTWNEFDTRIETRNPTGKNFSYDTPWEIEGDALYRRWFDQYFNWVSGITVFDHRVSVQTGMGIILPMLVRLDAFINHRGQVRFDLEKRFQWTRTVFSDAEFTYRPNQAHELSRSLEYEVSLMYSNAWAWAVGLMRTNENWGIGFQYQF